MRQRWLRHGEIGTDGEGEPGLEIGFYGVVSLRECFWGGGGEIGGVGGVGGGGFDCGLVETESGDVDVALEEIWEVVSEENELSKGGGMHTIGLEVWRYGVFELLKLCPKGIVVYRGWSDWNTR